MAVNFSSELVNPLPGALGYGSESSYSGGSTAGVRMTRCAVPFRLSLKVPDVCAKNRLNVLNVRACVI